GPFAEGLRKRGIATPPRARSTIALLRETGVLDTQPLVIHCVTVDDDDIRTLADHGAFVAHCPVANARLGHGIAPVSEMLDAGIIVAVGTDSVASNNRLDLLEEARIAQVVQRGRLRSHDALPADRLLRMITMDAARALGLDSRIGSLEVGKDADLCAVSLAGAHAQPVQDPAVALFHQARGADVVLAMVRGRILFDAQRERAGEIAALAARMRELAARLRAARHRPDEARRGESSQA
ncbi:MAG TPA: amidohydrolase family protein, partial [Longimicrobiales bacterium]